MKEYFLLQYKLVNRRIKDFVPYPIIGYILLVALFVILSSYLFYKTQFAAYLLIFCSFSFTAKLSGTKRNDFLRACFGKRASVIRIMENLILSIPFIAFLAYKQSYLSIAILLSLSIIMSFSNFKTSFNLTIPTPFYKKPFEFSVGFRNTFYLFLLSYGLAIIAIFVDNFNLGIFSLLLIFLTTYYYYLKPENEYYVWIYALSPAAFLYQKIRTGLAFSSMLALPVVLLLAFCYNNNIFLLLAFFILGLIFLSTIVLMKYSTYPNEIGLIQAILIALTFTFPPLLIITIPIFFRQSIKQLSKYLR